MARLLLAPREDRRPERSRVLPEGGRPGSAAVDCNPPPPAPEPVDAAAAAFVTWANINRPSVLPADGATELHLTGVDIFAQDLENTAVHLVGTTAREATCRTARDATRSGWAGFLRRIVANIPPVRLKPIQQGSDDDIDASAAIMRAACDWYEATPFS